MMVPPVLQQCSDDDDNVDGKESAEVKSAKLHYNNGNNITDRTNKSHHPQQNNNCSTGSTTKKKNCVVVTLGTIFHYLEGIILMIECKHGPYYYIGTLQSSTGNDMNLTLQDVIMIPIEERIQHLSNYKLVQYYQNTYQSKQQHQQHKNEKSGHYCHSSIRNSNNILPLVQIRGSKIRYIHFIDTTTVPLHTMIQQQMAREKMGQQYYQRGIRR